MTSDTSKDHSQTYLPHEVLSEIFEYLPYSDRKNASLVSKHWYNVSLDRKFVLPECIYFDHISYLANKVEILNCFINSTRNYHNIVLKDCEINSPLWLDLFKKYANSIYFLMIDRCDVSERTFVQIIQILRNLRKLDLNCNNQLLMSGGLFKGEVDISCLTLLHCNQLELVSNRYLSDRIIHDFFLLCPRIEHLSLKNSNISFHKGLYKRFYPSHLINSLETSENSLETESSSPPLYRSETVLTFTSILESLAGRVTTLSSLDLSFTLVNNESLGQLATLHGLKLKTIRLTSCDQVSNEGFAQLFQHQRFLTLIDVSSCSRLIDRSVNTMCTCCTDLRELRMRNCSGITDMACKDLGTRMYNLHTLDISHCNQITGQGVSELCSPLSPIQNKCQLKSLIFAGLNIVPNEFQPVLPYCTQLRALDLSHCLTMVSDETLRVVFETCSKLTELSLVSCEAITDWGLIGLTSQEMNTSELCSPSNDSLLHTSSTNNNNIKNLPGCASSPVNQPMKMFLGSKAEQEILSDTQRKLNALHVTKNLPYFALSENKCPQDMCGLNRVKGLTKLNLYGCNRISDVSLIYALCHLPFLQYLNLGDVQQISSEGIQAICRNNFRIISLKLHRCFNLQDTDVLSLAASLRTLRSLDVSNCIRLTDKCLYGLCLVSGCVMNLRSLNLQKCPGITPAAIDSLVFSLPSLHTILSPSVTSLECTEVVAPPAPAMSLTRSGAIRRS